MIWLTYTLSIIGCTLDVQCYSWNETIIKICHKITITVNDWHAFHTTSTTCHSICIIILTHILSCSCKLSYTKVSLIILKLWFYRTLAHLCISASLVVQWIRMFPANYVDHAIAHPSLTVQSVRAVRAQAAQAELVRTLVSCHQRSVTNMTREESETIITIHQEDQMSESWVTTKTLHHDESRWNSLLFKAWWNFKDRLYSRYLETWQKCREHWGGGVRKVWSWSEWE